MVRSEEITGMEHAHSKQEMVYASQPKNPRPDNVQVPVHNLYITKGIHP